MVDVSRTWIAVAIALLLSACGNDPFPGYPDTGPTTLDDTGGGDADASDAVSDADAVGDDVAPDAADDTDTVDDADASDVPEDAPLDGDVTDTDVTPSEFNACGGRAALRYDGEAASPGDACGCTGTLACNGPDALYCSRDTPPNACGSCGPLGGELGGACGACGNGTLVCDEDGLTCEGAQGLNLCGGCAELEGAPRALCGDGQPPRVWTCDGPDAVTCSLPEINACGGTGPLEFEGLDAVPGEACEAGCGSGRLICDTEAGGLVCDGPEPNVCGWCGPLNQLPVGTCGCNGNGRLECDATSESVVCVGGAPNVCGGCDTLDDTPGASCDGGGAVVCEGPDDTACSGGDANACGGSTTLAIAPGLPCGACESGTYVCDGTDSTVCEGDLGSAAFNGCGGCGALRGVPDAACGTCAGGVFACTDDGTLACEGDPGEDGLNACGGCATLSSEPGEACGTCAVWACSGVDLQCVFDTTSAECQELPRTCADLPCASASRTCSEGPITEDATCGGCLPGYVEVDGACVARECDEGTACETFVGEWSECDWTSVCDESSERRRERIPSTCTGGFCVAGATSYDVEACAPRNTDGVSCGASSFCNDATCVALPGTPVGVTASTDQAARVEVTWSAVAGADLYEIEIDGSGTWTPQVGTTFLDVNAGAPQVVRCTGANLSASDGDFATHVALACVGADAQAGAVRTYRVRAVNAAGASTPSSPALGYRSPGAVGYQWQSGPTSGGPFMDLAGADTSHHDDATAPANGATMYYRVRVSAAGAATQTSDVTSGYRLAPPPTPTGFTASDDLIEGVELQWNTSPGTTRYEVELGTGTTWTSTGTDRTYLHDAAPRPSINVCAGAGLSASQGTSRDHVSLSCSSSVAPGANVNYRVRAVGAAGPSAASAVATGHTVGGPLSYQWQYASSSSGPWTDLPGATSATFQDVTADEEGAPRWYRVQLTAEGTASRTSAAIQGYRGTGTLEVGERCTEDESCISGTCSNSYCAPEGFVYIPSGRYTQGSPTTEYGRCRGDIDVGHCTEEEQRVTTLTRPFYIATTEVTQAEWRRLMGTDPSFHVECGDTCPVERVNWYEAITFANARSAEEGLTPCYTMSSCAATGLGAGCGDDTRCTGEYSCGNVQVVSSCTGYRLPTDSEWEYAYRSGRTTSLYNGNLTREHEDTLANAIAWYDDDPGGVHAVGRLTANTWGLFDMAGNVWEWTGDGYLNIRPSSPATWVDPLIGGSITTRTHRGGYFGSNGFDVRAAARGSSPSIERNYDRGFRLARPAIATSCTQMGCALANRGCSVPGGVATCGACQAGYQESGGFCYAIPGDVVVTATGGSSTIAVSWTAASNAERYELRVDSGSWLSRTLRTYTHYGATAPNTTLCAGDGRSATWRADGRIDLRCSNATSAPGDPVTFSVRAVNGPVEGEVAQATARRTTSSLTYQWQVRDQPTSAWSTVTTTGSTVYTYTPPLTINAESEFRVSVRMSGATTLVSDAIEIRGTPPDEGSGGTP